MGGSGTVGGEGGGGVQGHFVKNDLAYGGQKHMTSYVIKVTEFLSQRSKLPYKALVPADL